MTTYGERDLSWLAQHHYADLDPRAERALREAGLHWHDESEAERLLGEAEQLAPSHRAVVIARYRYCLYKHRFADACTHAEQCLSTAARELGLSDDFREVTAQDAAFAEPEAGERFWLFALQAYAYVLLRSGRRTESDQAFAKVVELDSGDQTKTRVLVDVIARHDAGDD